MRITAPYRGRRATKRIDLTDMREVFRDRRLWCSIGRATLPPGAASHVEIDDDDVLVDVVLHPSLDDVTCRLAGGVWVVPEIGEEVVVVLPDGEQDFMPTIVAVLSTGSVPTTEGPALGRMLLQRPEVLVHDGTGGTDQLVRKGEFNAFRAWVEQQFSATGGHTHVVAGAATTTITTVVVTGSAAPTVAVPTITGTTCLKAK